MYVMQEGEKPGVQIYSRCEDELWAQAELVAQLDSARQKYPGREIVGTYDVDPMFTVSVFMKGYQGDHQNHRALMQAREKILREGWNYRQVDDAEADNDSGPRTPPPPSGRSKASYWEAMEKQVGLYQFWTRSDAVDRLKRVVIGSTPEAGRYLEGAAATLVYAEPFFWTSLICDMVSAAAESIPDHWTWTPRVWPVTHGFFWLEQPLPAPPAIPSVPIAPDIEDPDDVRNLAELVIRAISWAPLIIEPETGRNYIPEPGEVTPEDIRPPSCWTVVFWMGDPLATADNVPVPFGDVFILADTTLKASAKPFGEADVPEEALLQAQARVRQFACMLAFIDQRILIRSKLAAPRASRRRIARELGAELLRDVNVIKLRRYAARKGEGSSGPIDWSCRWLVTGHWRDQWYESEHIHRPKWIMPYMKGPEDKPVRGVDRLFAVVR